MTPCPQSTEKVEMKDQSGVGNNGTVPQDPGQLSNISQMPGAPSEAQGVSLAESEERLRQVHDYHCLCSILNLIIHV